jgi:hypothetical protein
VSNGGAVDGEDDDDDDDEDGEEEEDEVSWNIPDKSTFFAFGLP